MFGIIRLLFYFALFSLSEHVENSIVLGILNTSCDQAHVKKKYESVD